MYKIMVIADETANNTSTYRFYRDKDSSGKNSIWQTDDKSVLEEKVEEMLNGDYRKKDFIIVQVIDYEIETNIEDETTDPSDP